MTLNVYRWRAAALAAAALLVATKGSAEDLTTTSQEQAHVRSTNPAIAAAVEHATQRPATFRRLVETIQGSDSYMYLAEGICGGGAQGLLCFRHGSG